MKKNIIILILFLQATAFGQQRISLDECYQAVTTNYPLAKKTSLLESQNQLDTEALKTGKKPQLLLDVQATYQSDVIELPISIPNVSIESPNQDQYKATLSVNQLIYDGGVLNASILAKQAEGKAQQKAVEVSLYQLKQQINDIYFSILLIQEKALLLEAKKAQLEARLKEVKAGIKYGTLLPSSDSVLEAELIQVIQQQQELLINKQALFTTLSSLTGMNVTPDTSLETPGITQNITNTIDRPELDLFKLQKEQIDATEKVISKQNLPTIMGFATGGYGNPGLNMLDNSFQAFYVVGAKLNWNVFDWNRKKKQRQSLLINKQIIDNQEEVFTLNTQVELDKYQSDANKYSAYIASDEEIITLREKIVKTAEAQLKNGVITASAYITELTNLFEAKNNLSVHQIQLLLTKANYQITQGN